MYANVASGMRFLNREDLSLTPALGEVAAEAFCDETKLPEHAAASGCRRW